MGTEEDSALERTLLGLIDAQDPELVVVSGDLTHRGRAAQHERAAALLRRLGRPLFVVPGNHDIPYRLPARFTRTFADFERQWGETEPVYRSDRLLVVGLNSVRAWPSQAGAITTGQLQWAAGSLADADPGVLRVVVLHHHLVGAPWRNWKWPVVRRNRVLAALVDAGAELILAGHVHQAAVSERREFEVVRGAERSVVVSTAPGLGQPRPKRRGEARGLHVYDYDAESLTVATFVWRDEDWALTAVRRFPRGRVPLGRAPSTDEGPSPSGGAASPLDR
jgi:3',5'-cyclic AMP phosphodiesterase CpdA